MNNMFSVSEKRLAVRCTVVSQKYGRYEYQTIFIFEDPSSDGLKGVDRFYFTINRARQYGKTTTLVALEKTLVDRYLVIPISAENGSSWNIWKPVLTFYMLLFYSHLKGFS